MKALSFLLYDLTIWQGLEARVRLENEMKDLGRRLPNEVKGNICLTVGAHALRADGGLEQVRDGTSPPDASAALHSEPGL